MLTLLAQSKDAPRSAKSLRTAKSSLHFTAKKSKLQCSLFIKNLIITQIWISGFIQANLSKIQGLFKDF